VPLSEREQRILDEIEKSLYQEDPVFARDAAQSRRGARTLSSARRGAAMFVAGLLVLFAFFMTKQVWVGALAFGSMVWGIVVVAGALRSAAPSPGRAVGEVGDRIGRAASELERRLKQRYKRR
jgi:VIT1/CCC1 family predicted Fe2+/Mn2+ transporter